jgi:thiamine-phosphate pyrophosphorylase
VKKAERFVVCYVTDRRSLHVEPDQSRESALAQCIENAVHAGVDWVQIREKDLPARDLADVTRTAIQVCKIASAQSETRILVNDRFDVAWVAGAAGVHAGGESLPVRVLVEARRSSGLTNCLLGASCHSMGGAVTAAQEGADYLFFGPVFATPSKAGFGPPQGLAKLAQVCSSVSIPVIAIGGITLETAPACREAGAAGIAAIRLFQQNGDVKQIVAELTTKVIHAPSHRPNGCQSGM